jgi:hypothetical protein
LIIHERMRHWNLFGLSAKSIERYTFLSFRFIDSSIGKTESDASYRCYWLQDNSRANSTLIDNINLMIYFLGRIAHDNPWLREGQGSAK